MWTKVYKLSSDRIGIDLSLLPVLHKEQITYNLYYAYTFEYDKIHIESTNYKLLNL